MEDNTEAKRMADMDVSTPDIELPPPDDDVDTSDVVEPTPTANAVATRFDNSEQPAALPPGYNPSHIPGLMHPADMARASNVAMPVITGEQATLPGFAPVGPPPGVPQLSREQAAHVASEAGCEAVREVVALPVMPDAYEHVAELRRMLRAAQRIGGTWLDLGDEVLGELSHAVPGLNATVLNVQAFAAQASEMVVRASGRPAEWCATFEAIIREASQRKAWRLLALASGALLAGPFTATWDDAVDWCLAFWDR